MTKASSRGGALLMAMMMTLMQRVMVAEIVAYANGQKMRAIAKSRAPQRLSCAQAGFAIAKNYFAKNFANWNQYLATPSVYNPIQSSFHTLPAAPIFSPALVSRADPLFLSHPELFADLDGDGWND